jgi:hypothetical protein
VKRCRHSCDYWDVVTVKDYECEHGTFPWLNDREHEDVVSAYCTACERQISFGDANDTDEARIECRAAEIAERMDPWSGDAGDLRLSYTYFGRGHLISEMELCGIVGYLCDETYGGMVGTSTDAGWLAYYIRALDDDSDVRPVNRLEWLFASVRDQRRAQLIAYPILRKEAYALQTKCADLEAKNTALEQEVASLMRRPEDRPRSALSIALDALAPPVAEAKPDEVELTLDPTTVPR